jgi:hypothetical protein
MFLISGAVTGRPFYGFFYGRRLNNEKFYGSRFAFEL